MMASVLSKNGSSTAQSWGTVTLAHSLSSKLRHEGDVNRGFLVVSCVMLCRIFDEIVGGRENPRLQNLQVCAIGVRPEVIDNTIFNSLSAPEFPVRIESDPSARSRSIRRMCFCTVEQERNARGKERAGAERRPLDLRCGDLPQLQGRIVKEQNALLQLADREVCNHIPESKTSLACANNSGTVPL
ncbi:hypothetical protein BJX70DRAFT_354732 [Aspergillus crustosus]